MKNIRSSAASLLFCLICWSVPASAQTVIPEGTTIHVRTDHSITTNASDGNVYHGAVDQNVYERGRLLISRGSDAELIVRRVSENELMLDLDSVTVRGVRYGVDASSGAISSCTNADDRTQMMTHGGRIDVPSESLLVFQLKEPLRAGKSEGDRQKPGRYSGSPWSINITPDETVSWQAPEDSKVFVQVDGEAPKLFASGQNGIQKASFMTAGHLYVFILQDGNCNEVARSQQDLR
jgi:hypothetical protein